jgi:hypothetical protein
MKKALMRPEFEPAIRLAALAAWILIFTTRDAEAYIDPSAGGMLIQALLAGTAGVAVLGKLFWGRIKRLFGAADPEPPAHSEPGGPEQPH